ncbi:RimJ/RimL family protein N-acetyltransferase [Priestia taiwanensis]|uniref:Uncharacterized protein n=2 Tax=Priestia taiwanensis TaxID=1347902 RepID=A0A917ELJ2_9BACI|nr:RimJ/RimL family protein N-acetyltransferase [Priestia taiwanensis]GGE60191.1 hypothetical protein GCM10007140_08230 [Priestia taiwanensis]
MQETLTAAIESRFQNMKLNRINAFVALENEKSTLLLERLAFKKEGVYRDKHFLSWSLL